MPYPQRGPEVTLPMNGNAPIYWADAKDNPLTIQDLKDTGVWTNEAGYLSQSVTKLMTQNYDSTNDKARAVLGYTSSLHGWTT